MPRDKQRKLTAQAQEPRTDDIYLTGSLPRQKGNIQCKLGTKELNLTHPHLIKRGQPRNGHMPITYRGYSDSHAYLLVRKNMNIYEYAGEVASLFSDLDFGVIEIASGFDHRMRPRQLTSFIGPD